MAEPATLDLVRLLRVLDAHRVEYVLVGGPEDLDLVAQRTGDNLERLAAAMRTLGAWLRVAGLDDDEARQLPVQLDGRSLAQMELSTWRSDAGDFDVLIGIPDRSGRLVPYDELVARAEQRQVHGVVVRTAALDDIIVSKEWANRPKDHRALPELRGLSSRPTATGDDNPDADEDP